MKALFTKLTAHLGKLLSAAGASLVGIDLIGVAEPLKQFARESLGPQGVKWVAFALFLALLIRTAYTGWRHNQVKP